MAKRFRQYNTIRTDHFESEIAHYDALGCDDIAHVLRKIARDIGAPIRADVIADETAKRKVVFDAWKAEIRARKHAG